MRAVETLACHSARAGVDNCSDPNVLTDDDFTFGGESYEIRQILRTSSALVIGFHPTVPPTSALRTSGVTFGVGSSTFAFSAGTWADNESSVWWTTGLPTWTDGQSVSVRLSGQAVTPPTTTGTVGPPNGVPFDVKVVQAGAPGQFRVTWKRNSNRDAKWNAFEVEWRLKGHPQWPSEAGQSRYPVMYGHNNVPKGGTRRTSGGTSVDQQVTISVAPFDNGPLADEALVEARVRNARGAIDSGDSLVIHELDSLWSDPVAEGKAGGDGLHVPNRVQNVLVVPDAAKQLRVTWDEPTWDGGSPITHYVVSFEKMRRVIDGSREPAHAGNFTVQASDTAPKFITDLTAGAGPGGRRVLRVGRGLERQGQGQAGRELGDGLRRAGCALQREGQGG